MTAPSSSGRDVPIMVRTTQAGADYIDSQRGDLSRAEFVRKVLSEHAERTRAGLPPEPLDVDDVGQSVVDALNSIGYRLVKMKEE